MQYNQTLYRSLEVSREAARYLATLPEDVTSLVSRGYSGCAIASAMITLAGLEGRSLQHVCIRKNAEAGHQHFGGQLPWQDSILAIVDDFIDTGDTIEAIVEIISKAMLFKRISCILVHHIYDDGINVVSNVKWVKSNAGLLYRTELRNETVEIPVIEAINVTRAANCVDRFKVFDSGLQQTISVSIGKVLASTTT